MSIPFFHLDAFAGEVFAGNPAAVVICPDTLPESQMQSVAAEFGLPATAFLEARAGSQNEFDIRWFTPKIELPLCAHASLASARVVFSFIAPKEKQLMFHGRKGPLAVQRRDDGLIRLLLPRIAHRETELSDEISCALGAVPARLLRSDYTIAVFQREKDVRSLLPDQDKILRCAHADRKGLIVATARADPGRPYDFVSRFFAPGVGIEEDPVTGSAHCIIAPFWSRELDKQTLTGLQCSARGGLVNCEVLGSQVSLSGATVLFSQGEIHV